MAELKAEEVKEKPDAVQRCFNWIWSDLVDRSGFDDVAGDMLQDDRDELSALWKQYIADAINTETADLQRMLREAIKAVEEESELPGEMPDEMWEAIRDDRDASEKSHRLAVKQTKLNIIKRLMARGGESGS